MGKCKHPQVEEHVYAGIGKGVRCVTCHAVMTASAEGSAFIRKQGRRYMRNPIPLERRYWKAWKDNRPDPMSYEARMQGYDNIYIVRR